MKINFKNIENIIFYDTELQKKLPEFRHLFDQWRLSHVIPGMKQSGQRSVLELLNTLSSDSIKILEEHFQEDVIIDKLNYKLVENYESCIENCEEICQFTEFVEIAATRNKENVKLTFWR